LDSFVWISIEEQVLVLRHNFDKLLSTEEDLGGGITNVFTELLPVGRLEVGDSVVDIIVDVNTIDQEV
jgi:hypothetical protein